MAAKLKPKKPEYVPYLPMEFWSQIITTLDKKTRDVANVYGYGKISTTFTIYNGKIKDVVFNDEVRVRHTENKKQKP